MPISLASSVGRPVASRLPDVVGLGGTIAGLAGGLAMAIAGALIGAVLGHDIWLEPKQIASIVYGPAAIAQPGFAAGPVLVGTAIHFLVAGALGAIFGVVSHRLLHLTTDFGVPVYIGMTYGMLLWVVNYFGVLPMLNPGFAETYAASFMVQHLIYGAVTGLMYTWLRPEPYHDA